MKYLTLLITAFLFLIISSIQAQEIDKEISLVRFSIRNMKMRTVDGTFSNMSGKVNFDESKPEDASFEVCIEASTINTENQKRDKHLRSADFFEVEKYPQICYKSSSVEKSGNEYTTKGKLTMHGITKDVEIKFTYKDKKFEGNLEVNRFDYKIGTNFKKFSIGETANLTIICVVK